MVMSANPIGLFLSVVEVESILAKVSWGIKEVRFLLEATQMSGTEVGALLHAIQMASTRPWFEGLRK